MKGGTNDDKLLHKWYEIVWYIQITAIKNPNGGKFQFSFLLILEEKTTKISKILNFHEFIE